MPTSGNIFSTGDPQVERQMDYLFGYVCRRLVSLAIYYEELDQQGNPKSGERFIAYSGFVMAIKDMWFIVMAGHVLKQDYSRLPGAGLC